MTGTRTSSPKEHGHIYLPNSSRDTWILYASNMATSFLLMQTGQMVGEAGLMVLFKRAPKQLKLCYRLCKVRVRSLGGIVCKPNNELADLDVTRLVLVTQGL